MYIPQNRVCYKRIENVYTKIRVTALTLFFFVDIYTNTFVYSNKVVYCTQ